MTFAVHNEDCLTGMANLAENSIDAIVTDPPYGLSFMGKDWDHGIPGVHFWQEALRIAKPGAHLLAFGSTRTFHRLTCAIEDAGWEIRDCLMWVYGSGFPKSHDVSKAIDRAAGAIREVVGQNPYSSPGRQPGVLHIGGANARPQMEARMLEQGIDKTPITAPATPEAVRWQGWGTALKPAWEPVIVARKPLAGTVAENVLTWGTGAMNIDGGRVGTDEVKSDEPYLYRGNNGNSMGKASERFRTNGGGTTSPAGRWPANLIHDGSDEVLAGFPVTGASSSKPRHNTALAHNSTNSMGKSSGDWITLGHDDAGGSAARFFYCAKASKQDRDEGCEGLEKIRPHPSGNEWATTSMWNGENGDEEWKKKNPKLPRHNHHPTVKPTDLMRYLCRLITPPNGLILDPFTGSGSTGKAALLEGFRFIGFELEAEYAAIARARCAGVLGKQPLLEDV